MNKFFVLILLIPSLSLGNDKIYLNIKDFVTYSLSANKMLSLCKENHDEEMGRDITLNTLYAALNENLINEFQMNDIETSMLKIEGEAEIIVKDEGCDYATSLVYTTYYDKFLELRKFFVEEGLFD